MAKKAVKLKVWYDAEGDFLEVSFQKKAGYYRRTKSDQVMERVDSRGNIIGFSVQRISTLRKGKPLEVALV